MTIHQRLDKRALLVIAKEQNNRSSRHIENNFRQNGHGWLDENGWRTEYHGHMAIRMPSFQFISFKQE